jgi:hypothetical protein
LIGARRRIRQSFAEPDEDGRNEYTHTPDSNELPNKIMPSDRPDDIERARRSFAEELRHTAHVRSPAVVEAFATVPRELFAGPGPWRVLSPMRGRDYWTTDDADPSRSLPRRSGCDRRDAPAQQRPA